MDFGDPQAHMSDTGTQDGLEKARGVTYVASDLFSIEAPSAPSSIGKRQTIEQIHLRPSIKLRRFKNIVGFQVDKSVPFALHLENMETAELSQSAFDQMASIELDQTLAPEEFVDQEESHRLKAIELQKDLVMGSWAEDEPSQKKPWEADQIEFLRREIIHWNDEISSTASTFNYGQKTTTLTVNITQICNLHCRYCAAGGDGTYGDAVAKISIEKTFPQIEYLISKLSTGDHFHVIFLGGEPLLDIQTLHAIGIYTKNLCKQKELTSSFHIITNGTLINDTFVSLMEDLKPSLTISIDGNPETHDRVRPQKNGLGSSDSVINGINKILENKSKFGAITLHGVFNKNNQDVRSAYLFLKNFDVDQIEFTFDVAESSEKVNQNFINGMREISKIAFETEGEAGVRKIALYNQYFKALDQQIKKTSHCGVGKSLQSMSSRGELYNCPLNIAPKQPLLKLNTENVPQRTQNVTLNTQNTQNVGLNTQHVTLTTQNAAHENASILRFSNHSNKDISKPLIELNDCQTCWAKYFCAGGCLYSHKAVTGNPHQKPLSHCIRTRSLLADAISYYILTRAEGAPNEKIKPQN